MKKTGFTLIELIIVLALLAIFSMMSYPVYNDHLRKTRRIHMATILLDIAANLENHFILYNTYENFPENFFQTKEKSYADHYYLQKKLTKTGYTLEAIPHNHQALDIECGTLTIDQDGNKNSNGNQDVSQCWL